jgi:carbonic anhydrase
MSTQSKKTSAVIVRCMDKRHWGKLAEAIHTKAGDHYVHYDLTVPGGAGLFASLKSTPDTETLKKYVDIALDKLGAEELHLAVHGSSEHDSHGCGGYALAGFGEHYENPEESRTFSLTELKRAIDSAQKMFPRVKKIRGFYVTFGPKGENIVEEVI